MRLCHSRHSVSSLRTATTRPRDGSFKQRTSPELRAVQYSLGRPSADRKQDEHPSRALIRQPRIADFNARKVEIMHETILAIGAEGRFASLVLPAVAGRGATVRGLIRDPAASDRVRESGAAETVVGDLTDRGSIDRALQGVASVFYIAPAFLENEAEVGKSMVAAAVDAGVRRFVFSSVIHPVLSSLSNHAAKASVEEAVLDSGMEYTFLHPALFFQNYAQGWDRMISTGVLAEPWSTETRFSRIDYRDVAEVAAIALTEDRLLYGTFELCAEGALNRHEVAALVSGVLRREIKADRVDPATLGPEAAPMRPMFDHYDRGDLRGNALTLSAILERKPRTLRAYFQKLADAPERKA